LENDVEKILADGKKLEYINFNHIPAVTAPIFDVLKEKRPDIFIR
jgi:hypothetical protein